MHNIFLILVVILVLSGFTATTLIKKDEPMKVTETTIEVEESGENIDPTPTQEVEANPSNLTTLDLSRQNLEKVPAYVYERTGIQVLNLSHNRLTGALQAEVRHLSDLRILDLSDNQFTGVPAEIGQLKNLEVLNLSNNQLTGLPYELGNLRNLKLLDLRGNNYAVSDLEIIKKNLPTSTKILTE